MVTVTVLVALHVPESKSKPNVEYKNSSMHAHNLFIRSPTLSFFGAVGSSPEWLSFAIIIIYSLSLSCQKVFNNIMKNIQYIGNLLKLMY